jgi:hypothetical protein
MKSNNAVSPRPIAAALAASVLVLVLGLAYRALAARLGVTWGAEPMDPAALQQLPMEIADWAGRETPLDSAVWRMTNADAYISRRYARTNGSESVSLYVVAGVRARDVVAHRPEICYISAGWTLMDQSSPELTLGDGTKLPCSVFRFHRGDLDAQDVTVLDYFIADGQRWGSVSEALSTAGRRLAGVGFVTQVQIVSPGSLTADSALHAVSSFAIDSAPSLDRLLDDLKKQSQSP